MAMYPNIMHSIPFKKHKSKIPASNIDKPQINNNENEAKQQTEEKNNENKEEVKPGDTEQNIEEKQIVNEGN